MNYTDNTIIWQKWVDPFGEDEAIEVAPIYEYEEDQEAEEVDTSISEKVESILNDELLNKKSKNIKVMSTPMGIIPITENTASGKIFNFWTGHTNFNITKKVASLIEDTDGVECLDIYTRYRFRVAIGKAFDDSKVMREINNNVYEYLR
jgi:hypothetical protein